jgi:hypothetical protein
VATANTASTATGCDEVRSASRQPTAQCLAAANSAVPHGGQDVRKLQFHGCGANYLNRVHHTYLTENLK